VTVVSIVRTDTCLVLGGQQGWGQQVAEVLGQREQIEWAHGAGRALAQGREPGAQLGEEGRGVHIRRYFYRPIDRHARLFGMKRDFSLPAARAEYARLAQSLRRTAAPGPEAPVTSGRAR